MRKPKTPPPPAHPVGVRVTAANGRPGLVSHIDAAGVYVSHTDRKQPHQGRYTETDLRRTP